MGSVRVFPARGWLVSRSNKCYNLCNILYGIAGDTMKKEIQEYLSEVELKLRSGEVIDEAYLSLMLTRIGFYQHERLVHLIVTMTFAIMTVLAFYMLISSYSVQTLLLALLFLGLTVPYVGHYYFLENSTQKLYRLYYEALEKASVKSS